MSNIPGMTVCHSCQRAGHISPICRSKTRQGYVPNVPMYVPKKRPQKKSVNCVEHGRDARLYSTHGFRRAGATWAFQSKVPSELIQCHGDWRSDAYKQYLKFSMSDKLLVGERMRTHIYSFYDMKS